MNKVVNFIKRNRYIIIFITVILIGGVLLYGMLQHKGELKEENPFNDVTAEKSAVYMTGEKYALNTEQEQEYTEEKKEREKESENVSENAEPEKIRQKHDDKGIEAHLASNINGPETDKAEASGSGGGGQGQNEEGDNADDKEKEETVKTPLIYTSLKDNMNVSGEYITFDVSAVDYKGNQIGTFYFNVELNGEKIYSSGTDYSTGKATYRNSVPLNDGVNEVSIVVKDKEGNTAQKVFYLNADTQGAREVGGTVSIKFELETLGLGTIAQDNKFPFYKGESVAYVVDRFLKENGIKYTHTGTFANAFYINRIYYPGITNNYKIPDVLAAKLEEENVSFTSYRENELGEKDFYGGSGFCYMLNNVVEDGMSAVNVYDGDEIHIGFTLNLIKEYNGEWFHYGEW